MSISQEIFQLTSSRWKKWEESLVVEIICNDTRVKGDGTCNARLVRTCANNFKASLTLESPRLSKQDSLVVPASKKTA